MTIGVKKGRAWQSQNSHTDLRQDNEIEKDGATGPNEPARVDQQVVRRNGLQQDRLRYERPSAGIVFAVRVAETHGDIGNVSQDRKRKHHQGQSLTLRLDVLVNLWQAGADCLQCRKMSVPGHPAVHAAIALTIQECRDPSDNLSFRVPDLAPSAVWHVHAHPPRRESDCNDKQESADVRHDVPPAFQFR